MSRLKVFGAPQSTFVRTVRLILEEKGLDYDLEPLWPKEARERGLNPFGKIPVLQDGEVRLFETLGIAHYVLRRYHERGNRLLPDDVVQSARALSYVGAILDHGNAVITRRYILQYALPQGPDGQVDRATIEAALPEVEAQLRVYDAAAEANGGTLISSLSLADLYLWPILFYLRQMPEGPQLLNGKPGLAKMSGVMEDRASFQATMPPALPQAA